MGRDHADDLENATPTIRKNDIVMINTGTHRKLADTDEYYAYSPGLYKEAAEWLVEKQVKMVGVDVQALDHPLGRSSSITVPARRTPTSWKSTGARPAAT